VLYVVDSVIRQWVEKAKKAGQAVSSKAAPGTYASGVQMVRDALPVVLSDLVKNAPENQKEKISKLIDIWERGQTFPPDMIASMKQLLNGKPNSKFWEALPSDVHRVNVSRCARFAGRCAERQRYRTHLQLPD
jgi:protein NRD1